MPKRKGNLMEQIAEPDYLRLAFYKAAKGRQTNEDVIAYRKQLDRHLGTLRNELLTGSVPVGQYHYFTVYDPKERVICAASFHERVMHHAVMNVCHPVFESFLIFDTYATRKGKGQYAALDRAKRFARQYRWFCKMDVRKYFDSIDHGILLSKLERRFKDARLLELFRQIVHSYSTAPGRGIPIGNLTSQYFANFYLGFADRFLKEELAVKAYVRYMDDMVVFSSSKESLLAISRDFTDYVAAELNLHLKPACINSLSRGLPFLGYVVFADAVRLSKTSRKRFITKLKFYASQLTKGIWSQADFSKRTTPLIAFTQHAHSAALRRSVLCKLEAG
jgi:hypothetical protein